MALQKYDTTLSWEAKGTASVPALKRRGCKEKARLSFVSWHTELFEMEPLFAFTEGSVALRGCAFPYSWEGKWELPVGVAEFVDCKGKVKARPGFWLWDLLQGSSSWMF